MHVVRIAAAFVLVLGLAGCGSGQDTVMPDVEGQKLDVALSDIKRAGFAEEVEVLGGGLLGIIDKSNWQVCDQLPEPGEVVTVAPRLTVDRSCGDATPAPTTTLTETARPPSQQPSQEPAAASATPVASATSPESTLTANQVENFLKESYGIKTSEPWSSLCGVDKGFYPYPCAISQITLSSAVLRIRVQDAITEAKAETYAMYALNFLCATDDYTKKFAEVTWVEISDTSGGARGQQSAAVNRMCQVNR